MNIQDYLKRIHYQGSIVPNLQTLTELQLAHMRSVPFENLSVYYKEPIILTNEWLYDKIVQRNRGGFCYELNGLFTWLLRELGYRVTMLSAGVFGDGAFGPEFDHMTLMVHLEEDYLVDVGFGDSFQMPLRFNFRREQDQGGMAYQLSAEGEAFILSEKNNHDEKASMQPQYRFNRIPHQLADYEAMCHYHQTSPESTFTQKRVCSLAIPNGRYTVSNMRLIYTMNGTREEKTLSSEDEFENILKEHFNISL